MRLACPSSHHGQVSAADLLKEISGPKLAVQSDSFLALSHSSHSIWPKIAAASGCT